MKLQNMSIVLIIIVVPIILVLAQYTKIQVDTINIQTQYTTKLQDATYDAVTAFQINTAYNEFSTVSDSMRRDVNAAIQTFTSTLAQNFGISGSTQNSIMPYIPAIVFTLYDGYYIYAPSFNYTQLDEESTRNYNGLTLTGDVLGRTDTNRDNSSGVTQISTKQVREDLKKKNANKEQTGKYEHVLKPYIYYTVRYAPADDPKTDFIVNYSLDNYVVIYGYVNINGNSTYVTKSGYLVSNKEREKASLNPDGEILKRVLPVSTLTYTDNKVRSLIEDQAIIDVSLQEVEVTNKALLADRLSTGYSSNEYKLAGPYDKTKYREEYKNLDSKLNSLLYIGFTQDEVNLIRSQVQVNTDRKVEINQGSEIEVTVSAIETSQGLQKAYYDNRVTGTNLKVLSRWERFLTGKRRIAWFVGAEVDNYESKSSDFYVDAQSAKKYYDDSEVLTNWVKKYLGNIKATDARKPDGSRYEGFRDEKIFDISDENDPSREDSRFNTHKREIIKESIQDNLSQAIASYSQHSEALKTTYDYRMPVLSETEWDQVLKNVCMITFMQGMQAGTKTYNNYSIVTSTKNKEYIAPYSMYFIKDDDDPNNNYYHKIGCSHLSDGGTGSNQNKDYNIIGYKNTDFDPYYFDSDGAPKITKDDVGNDVYEYSTGTGKLMVNDKTTYYYMHSEKNGENYKPYEACYYCIVNSTKEGDSVDWQNNKTRQAAYFTALAREKYNFYKTNSYLNASNFTDEQIALRQSETDLWVNAEEDKLPEFSGYKHIAMYNPENKKYEVYYYEIDELGDYIKDSDGNLKYKILDQKTNQLID